MVAIVANSEFESSLTSVREATEVHDRQGRLLGFFTPVTTSQWR